MTKEQDAIIDLAYCEGFKAGTNNAALALQETLTDKAKRVETAIEYRRQEANKYLSQYKEIYINLKMHLSNCCDYQVKENTDICGKCGEHCETTLK